MLIPSLSINFNIDALDYVEITSTNNPLAPFTSDPSTHRQCFNVTIIDDGAIENSEDFFLNLTLAGNSTIPVMVTPDTSRMEIIDRDGNHSHIIMLVSLTLYL